MGERLNFVCLGNRSLASQERRSCIEILVSRLCGLKATLVDVMRIDGLTGADTVLPWNASEELVDSRIDASSLLTAYFTIIGNDAVGRQSVTLETRHGSSVLTLSLAPQLVGSGRLAISSLIPALVGWAVETFDAAAVAFGPELDLYEAGDERDLRRIEERLSVDWRCWFSAFVHSFPMRITGAAIGGG